MRTAETAWRQLLFSILKGGREVSPRGQKTLEVLHTNIVRCDLANAVVTSPLRKMAYGFMCAEALWIQDGDNRVEPLVKFNPRMAQFSDDGVTLAGAYGPRIMPQFQYVVDALKKDRDTRQAVLTIWTPNPTPSKDLPCTVAMTFSIREGLLHQHVFMRSSDAWLGVPYDLFSFSLVGVRVACEYNAQAREDLKLMLGTLSVSITSSHLYEQHFDAARAVLTEWSHDMVADPIPQALIRDGAWDAIYDSVAQQRDDKRSTPAWVVRPYLRGGDK